MARPAQKRILFVDLNDPRARTRMELLVSAGYEVERREDHNVSELVGHEDRFDLIVVAVHKRDLQQACDYGDRLARKSPKLPILLVTDLDVFVPRGTLGHSMDGWNAADMMQEIGSMLVESKHIREVEELCLRQNLAS